MTRYPTIKEKHIDDIVRTLASNTGLNLNVEHRPGGYAVYLTDGTILAFAQCRADLYRQVRACNKLIEILRLRQQEVLLA